ncbi:unnamed protein product [Bursaphelenchus okinawaensis]|uniref:Uncharacterized protein n=1 Tax=Bursaphelenchus okinawaensis TaxID=465554 RepID=A0A811L2J3_9BILA|nr:unnamed protein product [Bursaphelenchus okinawaensis]CAG9117471.1 unnamed protein product [Bursaphelenchus okinawaensis]
MGLDGHCLERGLNLVVVIDGGYEYWVDGRKVHGTYSPYANLPVDCIAFRTGVKLSHYWLEGNDDCSYRLKDKPDKKKYHGNVLRSFKDITDKNQDTQNEAFNPNNMDNSDRNLGVDGKNKVQLASDNATDNQRGNDNNIEKPNDERLNEKGTEEGTNMTLTDQDDTKGQINKVLKQINPNYEHVDDDLGNAKATEAPKGNSESLPDNTVGKVEHTVAESPISATTAPLDKEDPQSQLVADASNNAPDENNSTSKVYGNGYNVVNIGPVVPVQGEIQGNQEEEAQSEVKDKDLANSQEETPAKKPEEVLDKPQEDASVNETYEAPAEVKDKGLVNSQEETPAKEPEEALDKPQKEPSSNVEEAPETPQYNDQDNSTSSPSSIPPIQLAFPKNYETLDGQLNSDLERNIVSDNNAMPQNLKTSDTTVPHDQVLEVPNNEVDQTTQLPGLQGLGEHNNREEATTNEEKSNSNGEKLNNHREIPRKLEDEYSNNLLLNLQGDSNSPLDINNKLNNNRDSDSNNDNNNNSMNYPNDHDNPTGNRDDQNNSTDSPNDHGNPTGNGDKYSNPIGYRNDHKNSTDSPNDLNNPTNYRDDNNTFSPQNGNNDPTGYRDDGNSPTNYNGGNNNSTNYSNDDNYTTGYRENSNSPTNYSDGNKNSTDSPNDHNDSASYKYDANYSTSYRENSNIPNSYKGSDNNSTDYTDGNKKSSNPPTDDDNNPNDHTNADNNSSKEIDHKSSIDHSKNQLPISGAQGVQSGLEATPTPLKEAVDSKTSQAVNNSQPDAKNLSEDTNLPEARQNKDSEPKDSLPEDNSGLIPIPPIENLDSPNSKAASEASALYSASESLKLSSSIELPYVEADAESKNLANASEFSALNLASDSSNKVSDLDSKTASEAPNLKWSSAVSNATPPKPSEHIATTEKPSESNATSQKSSEPIATTQKSPESNTMTQKFSESNATSRKPSQSVNSTQLTLPHHQEEGQ